MSALKLLMALAVVFARGLCLQGGLRPQERREGMRDQVGRTNPKGGALASFRMNLELEKITA
jgi:hypothetical protein